METMTREEVPQGLQAGMGTVSSHKVALEGGANVITMGGRILAQEIRYRFTRDFLKGVPIQPDACDKHLRVNKRWSNRFEAA